MLVLDPRWPNLIPMDVVARVQGPVEFTSEVPVSVRWDFTDLVPSGEADSHPQMGWGWLVTTDPKNPDVVQRVARGESLVEVASRADSVFAAVSTMAQARRRGEWERGQTHESLLYYLEQEAGEFSEAVRTHAGDDELKKELSDLLLQVLFHAEIAQERDAFDFGDVAGAFVEKMRSRAPYLFDGSTGPVGVEEQDRLWAEGKAREQKNNGQ